MNTYQCIVNELNSLANKTKASFAQKFFRTGPGQYAEGDIFLGLTVPQQRLIAKKYQQCDRSGIIQLLHSSIHEQRLVALYIMVIQFQAGSDEIKKSIVDDYLANTQYINNWDLVDSSAYLILGAYLRQGDRRTLIKLAHSSMLWEKRIAVVATLAFIRANELEDTFRICEILLSDAHDLIHKACGWMLREAGKKDQVSLVHFLNQYAAIMPRTMLRYAIEKFSPQDRQHFLQFKTKLAKQKER